MLQWKKTAKTGTVLLSLNSEIEKELFLTGNKLNNRKFRNGRLE